MAKLITTLSGDYDRILGQIESGILNASVSASLEDRADFRGENSRCSVRVFERYSYMGSNRVSMSVTLYQSGERIHLCAVTSGGSQAVFFKVNTFGEEAFLDTLRDVLRTI